MRLRGSIVIAAMVGIFGCEEKSEPRPARAPTAEPSKAVVVTAADDVGPAVLKAADSLMNDPPEAANSDDKAKAVDAAALHGTWKIVHTTMRTNGKGGPPGEPIVPTSWTFSADGKLNVVGGMKMSLSYIYTGKKLIVTGMGPKQDYEIIRQDRGELELKATIAAGDVLIENTTLLRR